MRYHGGAPGHLGSTSQLPQKTCRPVHSHHVQLARNEKERHTDQELANALKESRSLDEWEDIEDEVTGPREEDLIAEELDYGYAEDTGEGDDDREEVDGDVTEDVIDLGPEDGEVDFEDLFGEEGFAPL